MNSRDDVSEKARRAVAARAGWHCSFAGCSKLTVGPNEEGPDKRTNISGFGQLAPEDRYVLGNELGDGRVLNEAPTLSKQGDGYCRSCPVAPGAPRVNAQHIGSGLALHPESYDLFIDEGGDIARVSGVDCLPRRRRETLSMQRGESPLRVWRLSVIIGIPRSLRGHREMEAFFRVASGMTGESIQLRPLVSSTFPWLAGQRSCRAFVVAETPGSFVGLIAEPYSKAKMRCQSSFIPMTNQPSLFASA